MAKALKVRNSEFPSASESARKFAKFTKIREAAAPFPYPTTLPEAVSRELEQAARNKAARSKGGRKSAASRRQLREQRGPRQPEPSIRDKRIAARRTEVHDITKILTFYGYADSSWITRIIRALQTRGLKTSRPTIEKDLRALKQEGKIHYKVKAERN